LPTCGRKEPLAIADIPLWIPERGKNSKYTVQFMEQENRLMFA